MKLIDSDALGVLTNFLFVIIITIHKPLLLHAKNEDEFQYVQKSIACFCTNFCPWANFCILTLYKNNLFFVQDPEMYELLYGTGGSPFNPTPDGNLKDKSGNIVALIGDVREIMYELKTDPKWVNTKVAIASKVS